MIKCLDILKLALGILQVLSLPSISYGVVSVEYSSYLGGSSFEGHYYAAMGGIAIDTEGCAYVSGISGSDNYPTQDAYQSSHIYDSDIFVSKLSPSGSSLIYSTYLGGRNSDYNFSIRIDVDDRAYLVGSTSSIDFPTVNAYQSSYAGAGDAVVTKLSSSGSYLLYSTYLGGIAEENGYDIAVDSDARAYITGDVHSNDFPTFNAYQAHYGGGDIWGGDAFVSGLSSDGSILHYSSYLGGADRDYGRAIAIASDGSICVVGITDSGDFPIYNAYQQNIRGVGDAYIVNLSKNGLEIQFATYLGGNDNDGAWDIVVQNDLLYVTGETFSNDFPTLHAYQSSYSGDHYPNLADAYLICINPENAEVVFSSYLGGNGHEYGYGIRTDRKGNLYVIGCTTSENFPTVNAYQSSISSSNTDAYAAMISASGSYLIYSTYFGGNSDDHGQNLAIDSLGCIYMSGDTESDDFPTINAYQGNYAGNIDTFISKFRWEPSPTPTPISQIVTIESGDYNGDGTSEVAVFRPSSALWRIQDAGSVCFGRNQDIPASGDYAGNGTSEIAVFRPSSGLWAVRSLTRFTFGTWGNIPVPRDYDADGSADAAIFRPGDGVWDVRDLTHIFFGRAGDIPVPADYNGSGQPEIAVFRPSSGFWAIRGFTRLWFGTAGDIPVPADYDLDGTAEMAIYRPSTGLWAGILTGDAQTRIHLGQEGDIPVPAGYAGDDWTQPAVFRPSSGLWAIRDLTRCWFGLPSDIPVTK